MAAFVGGTILSAAALNSAINQLTGQTVALTSPAAATVPFTVTGAVSQSANLAELKSSAGTVVASISVAGVVTANGSGLTNLNASNLASGTVPAARIDGSTLTSLNASNLASGTVPSARVSGSYTGITGVGALSTGSIPVSLVTGLAASATTDTTNAGNISSGTLASARISGSYTGITAVGTLTSKLNVDGASSANIGIGDWSGGATFSAIETTYGYVLLGSASDTSAYLRSASGEVRIGSPTNNTLTVSGTTVTTNGSGGLSVAQGGVTVTNNNVYIAGSTGSFVQHSTNTGSGQAAQWSSFLGLQVLVRNTSTRDDKENVQPLNGVITPAMVDEIDIALWNRKTAPGIPEIGPMAEDMDAISPFLSTRGMDLDEEGNIVSTPPNGINPNSWMCLLTIAIQDLRQRIHALEEQ